MATRRQPEPRWRPISGGTPSTVLIWGPNFGIKAVTKCHAARLWPMACSVASHGVCRSGQAQHMGLVGQSDHAAPCHKLSATLIVSQSAPQTFPAPDAQLLNSEARHRWRRGSCNLSIPRECTPNTRSRLSGMLNVHLEKVNCSRKCH